jgi:hypothetical protein
VLDRVALAQVIKQCRERREFSADARGGKRTGLKALPPLEHVRPGDQAQILGPLDCGEPDEVTHVIAVGSPRVLVVEVGEPLRFRRHVRKTVELRPRQEPTFD